MTRPDPCFSVVVPTYNRPQRLALLLESLAAVRYLAGRWELIVVDDGGHAPLEALVAKYRERFPITLIQQENTGPAGARNHGAAMAGGEFLAFIDDDSQADPEWLAGLAAAFRASPGALCGGRIVNSLVGNAYAEASHLVLDYLYENYKPGDHLGAFFPTNNLAVPRANFQQLGGLNTALRFGEDREFCYRWNLAGYPFAFAPDAVVRHAHDLNWRSFLTLHWQYGGGTAQFRSVCRARGGPAAEHSALSWYIGLVLSGLRKTGGLRGAWLSALLAAAQGAMVAGVLSNALRRGGRPPAKALAARPPAAGSSKTGR
jgi:glycosyltransferase involved in cell wall biosynthesis